MWVGLGLILLSVILYGWNQTLDVIAVLVFWVGIWMVLFKRHKEGTNAP